MLAMKSRICSALVVAIMGLVFVGCASSPASLTNRVALGMTVAEVESSVGQKPTMTLARDGKIRKLYGNGFNGWMYVDFVDGKASEWGLSSPAEEAEFGKEQIDHIEIKSDSTIKIE